jgi:uncharacterized protein YjbJ (UPF0337 family)
MVNKDGYTSTGGNSLIFAHTQGRVQMNKDVFEGKWKEMRGQVREWWGKLTDDELDQAGGRAEQLIGLLQQKYGYTREHAEEEFERRFSEAKDALKKD